MSELDIEHRISKLELRLAQLNRIDACKNDFLTFVRVMWPELIAGEHHRIIADKSERVARGEL